MFDDREKNRVVEENMTLNDSEIRRILVDYYYTKYNEPYVVSMVNVHSSTVPYRLLSEYVIMTPTMFYNDKHTIIVFLGDDEENDIETVKSKLPFYVNIISKEEMYEIFKMNGYFLKTFSTFNLGECFEAEATMQIIDVPYKVLK